MILPGSAPMYVRRWPRISASSRTPPRLMRTKSRPVARAIDLPSEVLPTPGGPTRQRIGPFIFSTSACTARYSRMRSFGFSSPKWSSFEDALRRGDVLVLVLVLVPGQREHPVDVVADHRRLGAHRRHHLELAELLLGPLARLVGHLLRLELLLELLDLVLELVALAELLLDRPHLLVEVVLLLRALHLLLDAAADPLLDLEHLDLRLDQREDLLEALGGVDELEQPLAVLELQVQVGRRPCRRGARPIAICCDRVQDLGRDLLVQLDVVLEGRSGRCAPAPRPRRAVVALVASSSISTAKYGSLRTKRWIRPAALPSTSTFTVWSGRRSSWMIEPSVPTAVDVLLAGLLGRGVALRREQELAAAGHGLLERVDRLRPPDEERHHHVREDDDVAERKQRHHPARAPGAGAFASSSLLKNTILALTPSRALRPTRLALQHEHRIGSLLDHLLADDALFDVVAGGDLVHQVEHRVLEDGAQAAGAGLRRLSAWRATARSAPSVKRSRTSSNSNSFWYCFTSAFFGSVRIEISASSSSSSSVATTGSRPTNSGIIPNLQQVLGLDLAQHLADLALLLGLDLGAEADALDADPALDDALEPDEGAAADEQDVGRVDLQELLLRVLAAALRRHARRSCPR